MTTANATLTNNEITVLRNCLTYQNRETQLSDNPSDMDARDIAALLGWNRQQAGGLMSSLEKKGMIWIEDDEFNGLVFLTDEGINAIFDIIEAEQQ